MWGLPRRFDNVTLSPRFRDLRLRTVQRLVEANRWGARAVRRTHGGVRFEVTGVEVGEWPSRPMLSLEPDTYRLTNRPLWVLRPEPRMSLRSLTIKVVLVELIALGVFAAFVLGAIASTDGSVTVDMTRFGERWVEYWVMVALTAVTPYVLYLVDQ